MLVKGVKVLLAGVKNLHIDDGVGFRIAIGIMLVGFSVCTFFNYLFTGSLAYLFLILLASGMSLCRNSAPER